MARFTIILAVVFFMLLQHVLVSGWWGRRRRCSSPRPSQRSNYATYNDYFYGTTSLWKFGKKREITSTRKLRHSILLFRGKIYEWGSGDYPWPNMGRNPSSCKISWHSHRKGVSKCTKSDIDRWNRYYKGWYGKYRLFRNNCHHYVNRLGQKLRTNCGR